MKINVLTMIVAIPLTALTWACQDAAPGAATPQEHEENGHVGEEHGHVGEDEHAPRPINATPEELEAATCEHGIKTIDCDECRYELGVVKLSPTVQGKLLKSSRVDGLSVAQDIVTLSCEVQADDLHSVQIFAPVAGRVESVLGTLSRKVDRGEVLASLYSNDFVNIRKEHVTTHQALEIAQARLARLTRVQADLKALLSRFEGPTPPTSADTDLAGLVIGKERAAVLGSFAAYSTAKSRWEQEMKRVADSRKLVGRLHGSGEQADSRNLVGGEWKEILLTADAELRLARKTHDRALDLFAKGVGAKQEVDEASRDLEVAKAKFQAGLETVRLAADRVEVEVTNELNAARAAFESELDEVALNVDLDRMQAQQKVDRAAVEAAATHRRLTLLGIPEAQIEATLASDSDRTAVVEIRAPAAGEIIQQSIKVGQTFNEGDPLFTIADLSTVWVWCDVYDRELPGFLSSPLPLSAEVTIGALPERRFPGTLDYVGRVMDETSRTVKVRIAAPNADGVLTPGMFATGHVKLPRKGGYPLVPAASVLTDEGVSFVFRPYRDDLWLRRNVQVGRALGEQYEILDGVALGDTVAADGAFLLKSDVLRSKMGAGCAD